MSLTNHNPGILIHWGLYFLRFIYMYVFVMKYTTGILTANNSEVNHDTLVIDKPQHQ